MPSSALTESFLRVEKKYLLTQQQFTEIIKVLNEKMTPDEYTKNDGSYHIRSLYYDTPCNRFISDSYINSGYKEKLRLRTYGVPKLNNKVFVEIKKKIQGIGNKYRCQMTLSEAYNFLETGQTPPTLENNDLQVLREITAMKTQRDINFEPYALINYDRIAFNSESGLRISFDTNIQGRTYDLRLEKKAQGVSLTNNNAIVMEVKVLQAMPLWLAKLLSTHHIYPCSFSKYKQMYHYTLMNNYT